MGFLSLKTKAGVVVVGGMVAAGFAYNNYEHPTPYGPELASQTDKAFHNGGAGFSISHMDTVRLAEPVTQATVEQAVATMEADMGDHSPRAEALGYCSIALENQLFSNGAGPVRTKTLAEAQKYSFAGPDAAKVPPILADGCKTIDFQLLPGNGTAYFAIPTK